MCGGNTGLVNTNLIGGRVTICMFFFFLLMFSKLSTINTFNKYTLCKVKRALFWEVLSGH